MGHAGHLAEADRVVGAGHREAALRVLDILFRRLQEMGGEALALRHDAPARLGHRHPRGGDGAHAAGADVAGVAVGVTLAELDVGDVHPERVGRDLAEGDLVALSVGMTARRHDGPAVLVHRDPARLPGAEAGVPAQAPARTAEAGVVDESAHADAEAPRSLRRPAPAPAPCAAPGSPRPGATPPAGRRGRPESHSVPRGLV